MPPSSRRRQDDARRSPARSRLAAASPVRPFAQRSATELVTPVVQARLTRPQSAQIAALAKTFASATETDTARQRLVLAAENPALRAAAAEELARRLRRPLHRADLSALVSDQIGETEEALARLFAAAQAADAVLLLDEGDALLSRRTTVNDAHDRYANLETAFRSQAASYPGVIILGTNSDAFATANAADSRFSLVEWPELPPITALAAPLWRRDLRLIRALLLAAERTRPVEIPAEVKTAYPPAVVSAHLVLLIEAGLLHGTVYRSGEGSLYATADRLTWAGHDAVASLVNDARWTQTQSELLDSAGRAPFASLLDHLRQS